ncbi:MAG: plasmid pRiA4b ORF-3 family protein [Burkholderiales bacterium]|nr:plasmid pRiA4b ORF-3 family protein [Burkholderiales bacterium]MDR4518187.1 plasmid pRiA4b ORF-3 family protein [Nitrosomonas sp.]
MSARSLRSIYQLKITLKSLRPPIWRRFLIASDTKLDEVHHTLQIVMGWTNSHLHEFEKNAVRYGELDEGFASESQDERKFRLEKLLKHEKEKLIYTYDFGDNWEHEVLLEKIIPFEHGLVLPVCIKGKRACPPEDIGGVWGYAAFLEAVLDSDHPEHEEMLDWVGEDFDSEHFDLDEVNGLLRKYC